MYHSSLLGEYFTTENSFCPLFFEEKQDDTILNSKTKSRYRQKKNRDRQGDTKLNSKLLS